MRMVCCKKQMQPHLELLGKTYIETKKIQMLNFEKKEKKI